MTPPAPRWPITVQRPVLWGDMDALGHVNNTVYFRWFEEARIALLDAVGLRADRAATGTGPILATSACRFRVPLTHPDTVTVHVGVAHIGRTSFTLIYEVHSGAHGALAAEGDSVVVHFDYAAGATAPLPEATRRALEGLRAPGDAQGT
ncbi:MAG: acyl-CoA thioesterase [Myxococcales bacterium]|nr:acyl-CoA thioesterase [Myxococcales bacterium]